ncbi:uncharacterized protein LOC106154423 [Lingula anatina]|uniref:Uncharacterized protein LOC106154423 n=1 Tax=Lingula anatina TaxID=7574 RepID=A0A1S3HDZ1_LINAN|nr:uncharacterized protein LOC106154423 [Lingula anatina]|eukprot:XP_013384225.1 uncharacterized protein LOC106154423 [Lingula anatina]
MFAITVRRHATISRFFSAVCDESRCSMLGKPPFRRLGGPMAWSERPITPDTEGSQGVTVRPGRMKDVPGVWKLTEEVKWNKHQDMIETLFKMCENGWNIAEKDGDVVGCYLSHEFDSGLKTAGHFIVSPKMQGRGVGAKLMSKYFEEFGDRNIYAGAISPLLDTYEKYSGAPLSKGDTGGNYYGVFKNIPLPPDMEQKYHLIDFRHVDMSDLIGYDTSYHVVPRPEMLKIWLGQTTAKSLVLLEKGKIAGYGSIRPAMNGFYLGPLYAENTVGTMVLLKGLIDLIPRDSSVDFFLPHSNEAGREILKANESTIGLYDTFHKFATKSYIPVPKWNNVFALLSNECALC